MPTRPGVYTVLVQVRHATLGLSAATLAIVVRLPVLAPAPQSTPILVHPSRREVWVANPDHGEVAVLDADTFALLAEIPAGTGPVALAVDAGGAVWVALEGDDALRAIDPLTRGLATHIDLGYGARPVALLFDAAGTGYVALAGRGSVRRFNGAGQPLDEVMLAPGVEALALHPDGTALYASRLVSQGDAGTVWRIALPAFAGAETIALPLDTTSPDSGTATRGPPNYIGTLALAGDGSQLWYGGKKDNILRGLYREGTPLTFETAMRSLLGRIDTGSATENVAARMDLDNAGRVAALLLAPGASHLFVAQDTNNRVLVVDPWNRAQLVAFLLQIDASEPAVAEAPQLAVTAPPAGSPIDEGQTVAFSVSTDLPQVVRVDYRMGETVVASATQPPWQASWTASGDGPVDLYAEVLHDQGRFHTLSPPVRIHLRGDLLFADGFEQETSGPAAIRRAQCTQRPPRLRGGRFGATGTAGSSCGGFSRQ